MADDKSYDFDKRDFGAMVEQLLHAQSEKLFGVNKPLLEMSTTQVSRASGQSANDLMFLADGLKVEIFSRNVAHKWT